ncbi:hypothetical protein NDU88_002213 [Pleurodeles waltl]|uniref:Uncharacterized protein n=1 Tax=Pleurodeles waltl TaxID=8319 RepID=A0AAV7W282_PLEWA|nr:hypothetical protein NDU88_002213 [Pleurodeles waltl]
MEEPMTAGSVPPSVRFSPRADRGSLRARMTPMEDRTADGGLWPSDSRFAAVPADSRLEDDMERFIQEIAAVGCHLDAMESKITDLSAASISIRADIASFQDMVTDLNHYLTNVEGQLATLPL